MLKEIVPKPVNRWIADHYGSRKGFLLTWWHRFRYWTGCYDHYKQVEWGSVERLVFICKGNVCRSPFAEVVARSRGMKSISGGIEAGDDIPANEAARAAAAVRGFSLANHRTKPLRDLKLQRNDLLVAMEPWQADHLRRTYGDGYMYTLLGIWGEVPVPHLHDPYGASITYYENCFNYIENSVNEIARKIS